MNPHLILPPGTKVVTRVETRALDGGTVHPAQSVGVIVGAPVDATHAYSVRFVDGTQAMLSRAELSILKEHQREGMASDPVAERGLFEHVILRVIVGSRAYGLDNEQSDTDVRGIYLPPAELQWSLYGVPEQLENDERQECFWELQKFLVLALKANPNVLECLYTQQIEHATPLARELLAMRDAFLSKLAYQTFNGYVLSQFKKLEQDLRTTGAIKWKHAMHLVRLLLSGIGLLRTGELPVRVTDHRERLLAIKAGGESWDSVNAWRLALHKEFEQAFAEAKLPERPDYERVNAFLVRARQAALGPAMHMTQPEIAGIPESKAVHLRKVCADQPYPLLFATISGAHLYGFPSPDSDFDLRGVHVLPASELLGLKEPRETIEISRMDETMELDLVTHDARKFFTLMLRKNGYVLEQLHSPLIVQTSPEHAELKEIARGCVTRHHVHHYLGFADTQWKLFQKENPPRVKPLLYVLRVLLTGIHLMQTGAIEANLLKLNEKFRLPYVNELVARKVEGKEKSKLSAADLAIYEPEFTRLRAELERAAKESTLPESASAGDALSDLLVRIRRRNG